MISKIIFAIISFFAFFQIAIAVPTPGGGGGSSSSTSQCNTGEVQCCNSVQSADDDGSQGLTGLLGILGLGDITGQVGLNCSPLSVIGVGGNSCSSQPVCCENNQFNGLINVGCTPINVNA
ncbi:fungal hydrophobin [Pluteus cervinus]|uniref:Fungal hydrophobin n=1 Tax=Pluteus cervinus TaxID=181527 RepID=A0ACD3B4R5_9AGAR|nr:fungal hydrophobin [Pluteus cervinus]